MKSKVSNSNAVHFGSDKMVSVGPKAAQNRAFRHSDLRLPSGDEHAGRDEDGARLASVYHASGLHVIPAQDTGEIGLSV